MTEVVVAAAARLHLGMLDPAGLGARRFGGFGVGVSSPQVVVTVRSTAEDAVVTSGPQADRARAFAVRARAAVALRAGVEVDVREAITPHAGLGSGTKLGLAIARGVAELAGMPARPERLAQMCGRGARSSVGCWTFVAPGLVVEAGVCPDGCLSPLVGRYSMPERWRCVLALPHGAAGLSGAAEERFFSQRHQPAVAEPGVSRLLLTSLLPGLLAEDVQEFGRALTQIQNEVGAMFAAAQGGIFHPKAAPLVQALRSFGVEAVGQSSWGPSVYGIVDGPEVADEVAQRLLAAAAAGTEVRVVDFDRRGACVTYAGPGRAAA